MWALDTFLWAATIGAYLVWVGCLLAAAWALVRLARLALLRRQADRLLAGCDRLRAAIAEADTPGTVAWLEAHYHAPAANHRNTERGTR